LNLNFYLTYHFIRSKKKYAFFSLITTFSIVGIAIGVTVLLLALQILDGFEASIFNSATNFDSDIKITGFSNRNLDNSGNIKNKIRRIVGVELVNIEPFLSKYTLVKSKANSDGIIVTGIDGKETLTNISKFMISGKTNLRNNHIVIGKGIAERMQLKVNDKVTIFALRNDKTPSNENPPNVEIFTVSGIFYLGMPYYDNSFAFTSFKDAANLFDIRNKISGYNIFIKDINKADKISRKLKGSLPYPYYSRSIFDIHRNIFVWIELQKKPIPIVLTAIILVAAFNIIGALFILVLQRKKTIGILRTLGFKRNTISKVFLLQGLIITLFGIISGWLLTIVLTLLQNIYHIVKLPGDIYFINNLNIAFAWQYYLIVALGTFIIGFLASWVPSKFASKITPISAIRDN